MRLLFCVHRDIYTNLALNRLLPRLVSDESRVYFSEASSKAATAIPEMQWMSFFEQHLPNQFLFPALDALANKQERELLSFAALAQRYEVPMHSIQAINHPDSLAEVREFAPDLIISIRFRQIFKSKLIQIPRLGILNLHSGPLPEYRGVLASLRAHLSGTAQHGYTLHRITDGTIDTGDIYARQLVPIVSDESLFETILSLYEPGAESILEVIETFRTGATPQSLPQTNEGAAYYSFPTKEEFRRFHAQGGNIINQDAYFTHMMRYLPDEARHSQMQTLLQATGNFSGVPAFI